MNIGIVSVDSLIPNLALMKLSAWHKALGDRVDLAFPLAADTYDRIYASKVFDFSPDDPTPWPCEVVRGGTGYTLDSHLPPEAEAAYPDYALFGCDYALGRITRGCVRRCPWCVVWRQDGKVRQVAELDDFWRGQSRLRLLDDNLTAIPDLFVATCERLAQEGVEVSFEALDIRFIDEPAARSLSRVRRWHRVHFAFDDPAHEPAVRRGVAALKAGGFPLSQASFYVLIGFNTTPEEDMHRVMLLDALGVESFAMPFDKSDPYQKRFARWVNAKPAFRSCSFDEYDVNCKRRDEPPTEAASL